MSAKNAAESRRASADIVARRREVEQALLKNLGLLQKEPNENLRRFGGPFDRTVGTLGKLRSKAAGFVLLPMIDFQLDPVTEPFRGHAYPPSFYPVAQALAEIGGPDVLQGVLQRLNVQADDRTLRACTWVLCETLGQRIAVAAVEQEAASEAKRLLPELWAGSVHKANLERARALLEEPATILIGPNDEAQAVVAPPDAEAK